LYGLLLDDALLEFSYPTSLAGYSYRMDVTTGGLDVTIGGYGYSKECYNYIKAILEGLTEKHFKPKQERFHVIKTHLEQDWSNSRFLPPHAYSAYVLSVILEQPHFPTDQLLGILSSIELSEVISWAFETFFTDVALEAMVIGNVSPTEALALGRLLKETLHYQTVSSPFSLQHRGIHVFDRRITKLNTELTLRTTMPNKDELNSAVYNYYQYGYGGSHDMLFVELFSMYIEKPAYHELRTTEQLGYIVWTMDDTRNGIQALSIRVQSGTRSADFLNKRIIQFVNEIITDVHAITSQQYCTFIQTLIATKTQKSLTLADEATRLWNHITEQKYDFELHDRQVLILREELVYKMTSFIHFVEQVMGKTLQLVNDKPVIYDLPDARTVSVLVDPLDTSHFSTAETISTDDNTNSNTHAHTADSNSKNSNHDKNDKNDKNDIPIDMGKISVTVAKKKNGVESIETLETRELKTLCDEFPLYPMRAVSHIPPLFDVPSTDRLANPAKTQ